MSDPVAAVEALYEGVVTAPAKWNEQMFVDWTETVDSDGALTRQEARHVRRALRMAQKLRSFWMGSQDRPDLEWHSMVDLAMGPRAWRPVLDLAEVRLHEVRSEEAFTDVVRLFPLVNSEEYLDGIEFEDWKKTQS
jgi:hypothetical protein